MTASVSSPKPATSASSPVASPDLLLAMLADARLPTGSHAHSAGLEPAVLAGLTDGGRRLEECRRMPRPGSPP